MPPHHHAELHRNAGRGQHRCRLGCLWLSQSASSCVHSRFLRNDFHFEFCKTASAHFFCEEACSRIHFPIVLGSTRIEKLYGSDQQILAGNKATCHRARHGVPRMLLREHCQWPTFRSGGLAQDGMARKRLTEARPIINLWLPGTVRSSKCGYHFRRQRHTMVRGNNRIRPVPSHRRLGQPLQRCR